MTKPTVYIDTTIPSYYVDTRSSLFIHIRRTIEWWDIERHSYQVYTSGFVYRELEEGSYPNQKSAINMIEHLQLLPPNESIEAVVGEYLSHFLMPITDDRDAIHLAFASFYRMDYLLTWNCTHLANVKKRRHIEEINRRLGLFTPLIVTPLELRL